MASDRELLDSYMEVGRGTLGVIVIFLDDISADITENAGESV